MASILQDAGNAETSKTGQDRKGKAKEPQVQTTLFVSSIPFTATSTDLSTLFSDIGPLKRAFVVTDKESGKSKGVGYVTFALLEDAQRAATELQGKSLDGKRQMRIEWAEKKAFGGRKKIKAEDGQAEAEADQMGDILMHVDGAEKRLSPEKKSTMSRKTAHDVAFKDKDAVRTIVMTGLAACKPAADEKTLYKRTRKIGDVESVVYPAPLSIISTELSNDVAYVLYRTPNHAMTAVEELHAHTFKGAQISVVLKKRSDGVAKLESRMRPETKQKREKLQRKIQEEREQIRIAKELVKDQPLKGADVNRGSRLIVRNLPFDVTDRDLRAIFLPYGPIYSIDVPQKIVIANGAAVKQDDDAEDESMVATQNANDNIDYDNSDDSDSTGDGDDDDKDDSGSSDESSASSIDPAEDKVDAVGSTDGKPSKGRGFAFVWMVSRNDATNAIKHVNGITIGRGAAEKAQLRSAKGKAGREAAKKVLEEVLKIAKPGRPVAVDWALSKKEWEQRKDESEAEETDKEEDDKSDLGDEDSDLEPIEADDDDEAMKEDEDENEDEKKPSLPAPSEKTTLFIRNLPYQTKEEELRDVFRAFGPLRYAKVTIDKATKRPQGTGFVCFWQKESADKALQQAQLVESEVGTSTSHSIAGQKNPFSAQSILTADPSAPLTASLNLHGRVLAVTLAVEKDAAENLSNKNRSAREKKDKRNTFLMREGVPLPGTHLASIMNEKEKEKRLANFSIRKTQLTKNPSLFISKTRLSIRQLPLFVSHKMLKRIGIYAVREFDAQVKRGEREDLSIEEKEDSIELMNEMHLKRGEKNELVSNKRMKKFVGERSTAVIQSKVMLQNDRIDSITGLGRSRGYGFLEMRSYADALKMVRFVNGDKTLSKLMITWYAAELESMIKGMQRDVEKGSSSDVREDNKERSSRLKRVEKKLEMVKEGKVNTEESGGRGGSIMVEFSIENVVVTKKRKERAEHSQSAANKRKRSGDDDDVEDIPQKSLVSRSKDAPRGEKRVKVESQESAFKKQKVARRNNWNQKTTTKKEKKMDVEPIKEVEETPKLGSKMGSLIGRKRKEKKGRN